jgi:hypothetical protein
VSIAVSQTGFRRISAQQYVVTDLLELDQKRIVMTATFLTEMGIACSLFRCSVVCKVERTEAIVPTLRYTAIEN